MDKDPINMTLAEFEAIFPIEIKCSFRDMISQIPTLIYNAFVSPDRQAYRNLFKYLKASGSIMRKPNDPKFPMIDFQLTERL